MKFETFKERLIKFKENTKFYKELYKDIDITLLNSYEDMEILPIITKEHLRNISYHDFIIENEKKIVRIHSTSGSTGKPVIIPYTQNDIIDWNNMFTRCLQIADITDKDVVQVCTGYGLWTAGIGFQTAAETIGATVVPMGPGNTDKQLKFIKEMKTSVIFATASYVNILTEKIIEKPNEYSSLKIIITGGEKISNELWNKIETNLKVKVFSIYGLTEVYGPGIAISCNDSKKLHYFDDYLYFEIIDQLTKEKLKEGQVGELVITTLNKDGFPLIRYNTNDLSFIDSKKCTCGLLYPKIGPIFGRSDDMIKVKGVKLFPMDIEKILFENIGEYVEYIIEIEKFDKVFLKFETTKNDYKKLEFKIRNEIKKMLGIYIYVNAISINTLIRSEHKTNRVIDRRF